MIARRLNAGTGPVHVAALLAAAILLAGCAAQPRAEPPESVLVHIVVVWLKEPGNPAHRATIIEGSGRLREIPGLLGLDIGTVVPGDRAIVDSSFDIAMTMTFPDREAMQAYLVHPLHVQLVRDVLMPIVDRLVVYDFITTAPGR